MNGPAAAALGLRVGERSPSPAPADLAEAVRAVTVTLADDGPCAFEITLDAEPAPGAADTPPFDASLVRPFNRVVVSVSLAGAASVLIDGVVTGQRLRPARDGQPSVLVVTGSDAGVMMDRHQVSKEFPSQTPEAIVATMVGAYAAYGISAKTVASGAAAPDPKQRVPLQDGTDRAYARELASLYGHVFSVLPAAGGGSEAYWGPPVRSGPPYPALGVNLGPDTDVLWMDFAYDALLPTRAVGQVMDPDTGAITPIDLQASTRSPALSSTPALTSLPAAGVGKTLVRHPGLDPAAARALAQATVDVSTDRVVTATGEVDAFRYGAVLVPRGTVGVRGAGFGYDGLYAVRRVTHTLDVHGYRQAFTLAREGLGSTVAEVGA